MVQGISAKFLTQTLNKAADNFAAYLLRNGLGKNNNLQFASLGSRPSPFLPKGQPKSLEKIFEEFKCKIVDARTPKPSGKENKGNGYQQKVQRANSILKTYESAPKENRGVLKKLYDWARGIKNAHDSRFN
jgi:hypothetical protein